MARRVDPRTGRVGRARGFGFQQDPRARGRTIRGPVSGGIGSGSGFFDPDDLPDFGDLPLTGGSRSPPSIEDILGGLGQEQSRVEAQLPGLEERLSERLEGGTDFGRVREEMQTLAGSIADEFTGEGGIIDEQLEGATERTAASGFGTGSGALAQAELNAIGGLNEGVSQALGRAAPQFAATAVRDELGRIGGLSDLLGLQAGRADDLRESQFAGEVTRRQLEGETFGSDITREKLDLLKAQMQKDGCGVGDAISAGLGSGAQGAAGGFAFGGPIGAAIGGGAGLLSGLFGGGC